MGRRRTRKPWERQPGETAPAFRCFCEYLKLGGGRSFKATADELGRPPSYAKQLGVWSVKFGWVERAAAYDSEQLTTEIEARLVVREKLRQRLYDEGNKAIDDLIDLRRGKMSGGDQISILDTHRKIVGQRPLVPPKVRYAATVRVLELIGLTVPKRIEHTGAEGDEIRIKARQGLADLSTDQLMALAEAFGINV
jgi:hypothetical protein